MTLAKPRATVVPCHAKNAMKLCSFTDIAAAYDATIGAIAAAQGIDPICSTSRWIVPAADAFSARSAQLAFTSDAGHVALLAHETPNGAVLSSFDAVWGFATPFIGPDPDALVEAFLPALVTLDFYVLTVSGLDPAGPLFDAIQRLGPTGYTDTADRCVADLADGFEPWLSRRSSRFRRSLRAAARRGEEAGVVVEHISPRPDQVEVMFSRLLAVEEKSWKTDASSGLLGTQLGRFTRAMAERFAATGDLRLQFAQLDGRDIGYVLGARQGSRYRGFQHSFDQDFPTLSIGKLLQFHTIAQLTAEGVNTYDMGMHMGYKESYADRIESTVTAVIPGKRTG